METTSDANLEANEFYEKFGGDYYLFSRDWWMDVRQEGEYFAALLDKFGVRSILDCSCGPGTQAIGLAMHGYQVTGSDISRTLLEEALKNASLAGVKIDLYHADMMTLSASISGQFDVVLSAGNALPHLETYENIQRAIREMSCLVRPGGWLILGMRDYDEIMRSKPRFDFRRVREDNGKRALLFDLWDYPSEGRIVFHLFILEEVDENWERARHLATNLYPVTRSEIHVALNDVGLDNIECQSYRWGLVFVAQKTAVD